MKKKYIVCNSWFNLFLWMQRIQETAGNQIASNRSFGTQVKKSYTHLLIWIVSKAYDQFIDLCCFLFEILLVMSRMKKANNNRRVWWRWKLVRKQKKPHLIVQRLFNFFFFFWYFGGYKSVLNKNEIRDLNF